MRLLFILALFCVSFMNANVTDPNSKTDKEKTEKKKKEVKEESTLLSKNFHSIRKWKITVEYTNGAVITKTITLGELSTLSTMDAAFEEAERYVKSLSKVKDYSVSPISSNSFVLLAHN